MSKLGFYCFTAPTPVVEPTMRQKVVALSNEQRQAILNGFEQAIPSAHLDHKLGLSQDLIQYVYDNIDGIQERAKAALRGEIVITPAVVGELGEIITPAVYNTPPTTGSALSINYIAPMFIDDFPGAYIVDILNEMYKWSKYDGTGSFAFYKSQIIL